ncbi:MAG TPA: asparagine synthase (glutamine-hydrolyzing) [Gaiellaceae bacterium]|nr:asparagine synthase (glutamine-hydrolyzing) [Gaiellaceae bacterium]
MCGICGVLNLDPRQPADPSALGDMNAALIHRGPDSDGALVDGPLAFAMRRLSIIDLEGGDQPIGSEDGSVQVIQNGEIYNYRELRRELEARGHQFATRSDTEVLVHLYEDQGLGFVERLRGMFAVALWDSRRRRLVLARDRFGIKPLYYSLTRERLSFASELKALLRLPSFSRELDLDALEAYLAFNWIPTPLTIFRDARKLLPGHVLVLEDGESELRRFARPAPASRSNVRDEPDEELHEELRARLRDSVRAHLVADVPVGVLLSGGIDSCTLAALAATQSGERIKTFSIGFEERAFSELDRARLVAERYGTDHHELIVRPDAVELLPVLAETFDEPFADSSALPTYLVSQLAASEVKVAFSGEGGDELFGGYNTYLADAMAPWAGRPAAALRPLLERLPSSAGSRRIDDKLKRFARAGRLPPLERHVAWTEVFSAEMRSELLARRDGSGADVLDVFRSRYNETEGAETLSRLQDVDLGIQLVDDMLVKTDRASMAHSLEARVPLLDPEVVDFALSLPASRKVRRGAKKRLLRDAVAPLLPDEIISGPKRGFSPPVSQWFRGPLEPFLRDALSPRQLREQGLFEPSAVTALIERHVSGREDLSRHLWGLLSFSLWYERYGDRAQTRA